MSVSAPSFSESESMSVSITETPEFKAALAEEIAKAIPTLRDTILQSLGDLNVSPSAGVDRGFAEALAISIAELTDQGTGRGKKVSPEVIRFRAESRERMVNLIEQAKADGRMPSYRLLNKIYFDEVLVDPVWVNPVTKAPEATEVDWPGIPNEAMQPINEVAEEIFREFKNSIGNYAHPVKDEKMGITPGGLVVKGGAVQHRRELKIEPDFTPNEGGLSIKHKGKPGQYKEVRILGHVAAPARQSA